ncbi:helix-turn-helix transcriptional regulator [Streptomyces sp. ACA25]|uniref:helix-turn-helix domain-containing protein n=1 Tax=Streptomyces sp. ACA25 TaxID=3022596 RepID=UPI002306DE4B|nr:helix-turn-helix transcriptional regulator [Streptomyces sp. ACA25]MDB1086733.1 helix-turn-helix transcriptional regulator [Streptomyces sp. ACA25]
MGRELKSLREAASATREEVAERLGCDLTKISRIELGRSGVRKVELETMLDMYGVTDRAKRTALLAISRTSRTKGWWHQYDDLLRPSSRDLFDMEADADTIFSFEMSLVPGLLQTEEYARALIAGGGVCTSSEETTEALVKLRMERQSLFNQVTPPRLIALIDEAALRRPVGGPSVMARQLRHLNEITSPPSLAIHVLPLNLGVHPGIDGPFHLISYAPDAGFDVALLDHRYSGIWLEEEEQVNAYRTLFDHIRSMALSSPQSRSLIDRLAQEFDESADGRKQP